MENIKIIQTINKNYNDKTKLLKVSEERLRNDIMQNRITAAL